MKRPSRAQSGELTGPSGLTSRISWPLPLDARTNRLKGDSLRERPVRIECDLVSRRRPGRVELPGWVVGQPRRGSITRKIDQPDIELGSAAWLPRQLRNRHSLFVRTQIEIEEHPRPAHGSEDPALRVHPGQLGWRPRGVAVGELPRVGYGEHPTLPRRIDADLGPERYRVATEPARAGVEGLRHQIATAHEEQMARCIGRVRLGGAERHRVRTRQRSHAQFVHRAALCQIEEVLTAREEGRPSMGDITFSQGHELPRLRAALGGAHLPEQATRPREDDLIGTIPRTADRRNRAAERRVAHHDRRPAAEEDRLQLSRREERDGLAVRLPERAPCAFRPGQRAQLERRERTDPQLRDAVGGGGERDVTAVGREGKLRRGARVTGVLGQRNCELHGFRGSGPRIAKVEHRQPAQRKTENAGHGPGDALAGSGGSGSWFDAGGTSRRQGGTFLQLDDCVGDVAQALLRVLSQASLEQRADWSGRVSRQRGPVGLALENVRDRVGDRGAVERAPSRQHLEQHAAERPDVRAFVDGQPARLLGAHVRGRAQDSSIGGAVD